MTLPGPVKYAPVMRQNCLPHVVKRPISTRAAKVHTAAIAQALAIHTSDVQTSEPQSSVGVNNSAFRNLPDTRDERASGLNSA